MTSVAVTADAEARRAAPARRLPVLRGARRTASRSRTSTRPRRPQKPRQVLDAMRDFYETRTRTCTAASTGSPSARPRATRARARRCARFVNAPSTREVIFTRSATEALNLVAYAWGLDNLGPGDVVVVTELEHHSNFVPWQYVAEPHRRRASGRSRSTSTGELQLDALDEIAARGQRQGRRHQPRLELARDDQPGRASSPPGRTSRARSWSSTPRRRRRTGRSTSRRSAATSSPSRRTRCAARAASARSGAARELLEAMAPFNLGGEMIRSVALERTTWDELPYKFEAGTPRDRGGRRLRRRDRLPHRGRPRRDRAARARARPRTRSSGSPSSTG